jgi:hypothetical protein
MEIVMTKLVEYCDELGRFHNILVDSNKAVVRVLEQLRDCPADIYSVYIDGVERDLWTLEKICSGDV